MPKLIDFWKWTGLIIELVLECLEHVGVNLELKRVVCSCDSRHIPSNVVVLFNTFNPLSIYLHEEVNEDAHATDVETYHFSSRLLVAGNQTWRLDEKICLIVALSPNIEILYTAQINELACFDLAFLFIVAVSMQLLVDRIPP